MKKKSIYNLNEDEELTHYGQSLADIEKHNDIVDSDSDAEERGTLSGEGWGQGDGLLLVTFFLSFLETQENVGYQCHRSLTSQVIAHTGFFGYFFA